MTDRASDLERNKQTVLAFFDLAFNEKKPAEAAAKFIGDKYVQHNPQAGDGKEAFVQFATWFTSQFPGLRLEVKRVVAEGDVVATHSLLKTSPDDRGTVAADLCRLENGKIVEHWDVLQPFPETAVNEHPMF